MYEVTQKLQFYTFFYPLNVLIPSSCSQQCNGLTIFWLAEKTRLETPIKRSKIKLLYLPAQIVVHAQTYFPPVCQVWIYTQSNITQASYSPEYIAPTQQIS
jgi:hypothetical protein